MSSPQALSEDRSRRELYRSMSPEHRLLVSCSRVAMSQEHFAEIREILQRPIDWRSTLALAHLHRLSAFLATRLSGKETAALVPEPVLEHLRASYLGNAVLYLRIKAEIRAALEVLRAEGIPVILLKGAALAEEVYRDPALRPMGDVDILVGEHDLERADDVVRSLGYAPRVTAQKEQIEKDHHRHYPRLASSDGILFFEVHRHVVRKSVPFYFDISDFWARARTASLAGVETLLLRPEDLLIHLCIGFFLDSRSRYPGRKALARLVDISETIRHFAAEIDWDSFARTLGSYGLFEAAAWGLMATRELLGTGPPERTLKAIGAERLDETMIELFIERRVLRGSPWIFHELLEPPDSSRKKSFKSALRRLFPSSSHLRDRYARQDGSTPSSDLYTWHALEVGRSLSQYLIRPRDWWRDLRVDRWLNAAYAGTSGHRINGGRSSLSW